MKLYEKEVAGKAMSMAMDSGMRVVDMAIEKRKAEDNAKTEEAKKNEEARLREEARKQANEDR